MASRQTQGVFLSQLLPMQRRGRRDADYVSTSEIFGAEFDTLIHFRWESNVGTAVGFVAQVPVGQRVTRFRRSLTRAVAVPFRHTLIAETTVRIGSIGWNSLDKPGSPGICEQSALFETRLFYRETLTRQDTNLRRPRRHTANEQISVSRYNGWRRV